MPSPNPAGPRPWLFAVKMPHGPRSLLIYLWTYGPHWQPADALPGHGDVLVWPSPKTMRADFAGTPGQTIKAWLRWLRVHGWIKREGDRYALAVAEPCAAWLEGDGVASDPEGVRSHPDRVKCHPGEEPPSGGEEPPSGGEIPPPAGEMSPPQLEPAKEPAKGTCTEPANLEAEERDQRVFSLEPDPTSELEQLVAEHDRARREALAAHGKRRTALPGPASKSGKALRSRAAKAIRELGLDRCREVLAWQAARWREDPGQLTWSTDSVWSPKSLDYAQRAMARSSNSTRGQVVSFAAAPNRRATEDDFDPEVAAAWESFA